MAERFKHDHSGGRRHAKFPDVSIGKIAEEVGVHPSYLGLVLSGKAKLNLTNSIKLAAALNITIEEVEKLYEHE